MGMGDGGGFESRNVITDDRLPAISEILVSKLKEAGMHTGPCAYANEKCGLYSGFPHACPLSESYKRVFCENTCGDVYDFDSMKKIDMCAHKKALVKLDFLPKYISTIKAP
jgi:hypothetical protein